MSEWWTYGLSDFLMFSPQTYWRLIELHQRALWPAQLVAAGAGLACLVLARRAGKRSRCAGLLVVAVSWLWVGWSFHLHRYATINWAAVYLGAAFLVEALLLVALAWGAGSSRAVGSDSAKRPLARAGWWLAAAAVVLYPLAGLLAGRPLVQSDLFAITPEPTALATLGLLPSLVGELSRAWLWAAAALPALSLVIGAATLWTMAH